MGVAAARACVALLFAALLLTSAAWREAAAAPETVRVGVYENAPKIFTDEEGVARGIFPDVLNAIAEEAGWTVEWVHGTWAECLNRLEAGEIDLMPDVAWSEERAQLYEFGEEPVLSTWSQVYTRPGSGIRSLLDLDLKPVILLESSVQHAACKRMAGDFGVRCKIVPADDYETGFRMLRDGEAEAAITNRFFGETHYRDYGLESTGIVFHPARLHFAASKERSELLGIIDLHLVELKADANSVLYASLERWIGTRARAVVPNYVRRVIWIAIGLILAVSLLAVVFRWQVRRRTAELKQRAEELRVALGQVQEAYEEAHRLERLYVLGEMASGLAHDFNNVLSPIIGYTDVLLNSPDAFGDPKRARERLEIILQAGRDGTEIVQRMREFTKRSDEPPAHGPVDPGRLLESVVVLAKPRWGSQQIRGAHVDMHLDLGDVPAVSGREAELREALMNLVLNALDAMPEGGVLTLRSAMRDGHVALSVVDTGTGMTEDTKEQCLRPFFTTKGRRGTGMGLTMVAAIAERHGAEFEIESEPGRGTTISILLAPHPGAVSEARREQPV